MDHAYGVGDRLPCSLLASLQAMKDRLEFSDPVRVTANMVHTYCIYTDASYEAGTQTGGLGGVFVNGAGNVLAWFGIKLDSPICYRLGSSAKGTIIMNLNYLLR